MFKNIFKFKLNFLKANFLLCVIFFSIAFLFSGCSDFAPSIEKAQVKLIYEYDSYEELPVQKMSVFLEMKSDVRRIDLIDIYNTDKNIRWVIENPVIMQSGNVSYSGYTNLSSCSQLSRTIPDGNYSVFYIDSQGNESFANYSIEYNRKKILLSYKELKKELKDKNPKTFIGVYSNDGTVIYYGLPETQWKISFDSNDINRDLIFSKYKDAEFFRLFYEDENSVYIMPKILKAEK